MDKMIINQISIAEDYEAMSVAAAEEVVKFMSKRENPLLCAASGDTPAGLYRLLVEKTPMSHWNFIGLDEWSGMNGEDEGSCRNYLDKQLFLPAKIEEKKICFFNGRAKDGETECRRIENFIQEHKHIDVAILGLGMNGHAGMNEPGTSFDSLSHVSTLAKQTQEVGQKYFKKETPLTTGFTLGLGTLMKARHIILLVSGSKKASILNRVMREPVSIELPMSIFRNHPSFSIHIDKNAAGNYRY